ncbi:(E2-independent) E3 ubiquitin-conjugating enzyme FATS isoform X2 [Trichechus manatus latirostris]|uniref:(E2-independent) E3 ubiquitin-conjugating enzyme FATS isoform X2 n=1 Tax=Trichechus manatus latirostris TaxID=127582 RepID=A0A2Y9QQD7_TRIMA|nr:(E2-independent) E3 ubiquitin-conjugating enzyme FATS isoform X2 [Trichechus manatus latirostris]
MRHSGIPTKTHQKGFAACHVDTPAHQTFQIKTFSTELKSHVMVMDFVKSNWFPSPRRAKVCMIRMCPGLKTEEQTAGRYEIHSRLFSSPTDHSAWERNTSLSNTGFWDNQYSTNDQTALRKLQSDVTEKKSHFAEEPLASQNTNMISSILISQLIDENESREKWAVVPEPRATAQWPAHHMKPSSAGHSGDETNGALACLPGRLGIQTPSDARGPGTELLPQKESPRRGPRKGFSSISVTARRVGPPGGTLLWESSGDPLCTQPRAVDASRTDPSALASGAEPGGPHRPFVCTEFSRNGSVVRLKVPEVHPWLCEGREYWVTSRDSREDSFSPGSPPPGRSPLLFSSCVHLRVSQPCPNSIYYLDKSLSVPIKQPPIASPQVHRSVLSLNLHCSSPRSAPDGVGGLANGEPMSCALSPTSTAGNQTLPGPSWNPGLRESYLEENPALARARLGNSTCPWSGSPTLGNTGLAGMGMSHGPARKGREDHGPWYHASGHASQLTIHIPGWSYAAGNHRCCDLVVKIKECKKSEDVTMPQPSPASLETAPPEEPDTPGLSEDCSEPQQTPVSALTLQEALEVHKPQFISRSRERLKKLEHMVQQRKAQRGENPGQKQSLLPVRANKKQFTVPHPLSDNLFKPKERCISEKEMYTRSKRIYNNLPEVKKKKEEQKKRGILQSNRLRAEVFKKQLLDQLLQRNAV